MYRVLIIDINFFPSYKEVVDFPAKLRRYFRKLTMLARSIKPIKPTNEITSKIQIMEKSIGGVDINSVGN